MTTTISRSTTPSVRNQVSLHLLINQLSVSCMPTAIRRKSFVVNDIPAGMYVNADVDRLSSILGTLLNSVISQTADSCIRISAKPYGEVMLVHIKDHHNLVGREFTLSINDAQKMAESIGGTVTVNNFRNEETTIALSFINSPAAA